LEAKSAGSAEKLCRRRTPRSIVAQKRRKRRLVTVTPVLPSPGRQDRPGAGRPAPPSVGQCCFAGKNTHPGATRHPSQKGN
jgi:hypothetical protein